MNVLITGCSFTQGNNDSPSGNEMWIPWSNLVHFDGYDVRNVAKSSYGQGKIVQSVVQFLEESDQRPDLVIIQLSAILRGYSTNVNDFYFRITNQRESFFLLHDDDYITPDAGWVHKVSIAEDELDSETHWNAYTKVLLLKTYLQQKNQDYIMFWGWNQLENCPTNIKLLWKKNIYDENFWSYGTWGGMSEYITDKIGKKGIIPMDFHPSTEGHQLFYNDIIKPKLKDYFGY